MSKIFVTADLHIYDEETRLKYRSDIPNLNEVNETIIKNWNTVVEPNDYVYVLGDIHGNPVDKSQLRNVITKLNGTKYLLLGNHDTLVESDYLDIGFYEVIREPYQLDDVIFTHHPINKNFKGINIHGHLHSGKRNPIKYFNVCTHLNDYYPVNLNQIVSNVNLGIRGHDLGENLIGDMKKYGLSHIQLVLKKSYDFTLESFKDRQRIEEIASNLKKGNVQVGLLGAYFNPIHSDEQYILDQTSYFKEIMKIANMFDCPYVGTETGSVNDDEWTYHPENHSEKSYQKLLTVFKELVFESEQTNTYLNIEPVYNHVIYDINRLKRLINDLDSHNVRVTFDLFNLLNEDNYKDYKTITIDFLTEFHELINIIHLKDFIYEDEFKQVAIGEGYLDYEFIFKNINSYCDNPVYILEEINNATEIECSLLNIYNVIK